MKNWQHLTREDFDGMTAPLFPAELHSAPLSAPGTLFEDAEDAELLGDEDQAAEPGPLYVIPCSAEKAPHQATPRQLYTGQMFRHTLEAAESAAARTGGRVLVLSAFYGLVELDGARLFPYNVKMTDKAAMHHSSITSQARLMGITGPVRCFLPRAYFATLAAALRPLGIVPDDLYEGCRGIGDQRAVNARHIARGTVRLEA